MNPNSQTPLAPIPEGVPPADGDQEKKLKKRYRVWSICLSVILIGAVIGLVVFWGPAGRDGPKDTQLSTMHPAITEPESTASQTTQSPPATAPAEWSHWVDELPAGVTADSYSVEEQILYRKRTLETTSSTSSSMAGWELYDTVEADGGFGPWSDWLATAVTASDTREVENQCRYRYRTKETTTSSSAQLSGWELYDTAYSWGDYGAWSTWDINIVFSSESRDTESKTQYRYRTITTGQEYTDWGAWSDWSWDAVLENDSIDVETRTVYRYYYFVCSNCGNHTPYWGTSIERCGQCKGIAPRDSWHEIWSSIPYSQSSPTSYNGYKMYTTSLGDGKVCYFNTANRYDTAPGTSSGDGTVIDTKYRYRTRSLQTVNYYGEWSEWQDSAVSDGSSIEAETRTVYRYRDREQIPTYLFWRWGEWSEWSLDAVSETENRQVEKGQWCRYRDREITMVYNFRRWGEWSEFSAAAVTADDTTEVETKTQYRYRAK